MKKVITITLLCVLYHIVPVVLSLTILSGSITVILILGAGAFKSVAGMFFIPFMLSAAVWALRHTYFEIRDMIQLNLAN